MYESVDMNRESFFLESDILDPNISRDGHVRFTHGLHNTIQVRSIGTNGVVIARSNHHGGLNTKEEVGYGTTVSVNVDDHIWLYKEYDSLRKNHSKYKHEFIVNRVERENTKAGKRRKLRQKCRKLPTMTTGEDEDATKMRRKSGFLKEQQPIAKIP